MSIARLMWANREDEAGTGFAQFAFQVYPKHAGKWRFLVVTMLVLEDGSVHVATVFAGNVHGAVHFDAEKPLKVWRQSESGNQTIPNSPGLAMRMLGIRHVIWDPSSMGTAISDEDMVRLIPR